jgi:transposase
VNTTRTRHYLIHVVAVCTTRLRRKAYDTDAIRANLKARGIKPVIPPKSNRTATIRYSKRLYRQRNCIERVLGHLKINRAIATRYDQLADSFLGMLCLASARYWIKFVHAALYSQFTAPASGQIKHRYVRVPHCLGCK